MPLSVVLSFLCDIIIIIIISSSSSSSSSSSYKFLLFNCCLYIDLYYYIICRLPCFPDSRHPRQWPSVDCPRGQRADRRPPGGPRRHEQAAQGREPADPPDPLARDLACLYNKVVVSFANKVGGIIYIYIYREREREISL